MTPSREYTHQVPDLIRLLDDPDNADALDRAFGEPEPLDIDEKLLPHPGDQRKLFIGITAGSALLVVLLLFGVVLAIRRPDGTLLLKISEPEHSWRSPTNAGTIPCVRVGWGHTGLVSG
jgi:hypothetical protein